ncbi:hypothetical protein O7A70_25175 [Mesorhizobium sp. Cs1299R1N1]
MVQLAFSTFAAACFVVALALLLLLAEMALPLAGAATKPWSARGLNGAASAALKAKLITPAARAAVKTVNFCM